MKAHSHCEESESEKRLAGYYLLLLFPSVPDHLSFRLRPVLHPPISFIHPHLSYSPARCPAAGFLLLLCGFSFHRECLPSGWNIFSPFRLPSIPHSVSLYLLADAINPSKQSDVKIRKYSNPRTTSCTHTSYRLIQLHLLPPQVTASSSGSTCYIETEHRRPYIRLRFAAFALRISGPALHGDSKKLQTRSRSLAGTLFGQL
jgi:hypothetical protein